MPADNIITCTMKLSVHHKSTIIYPYSLVLTNTPFMLRIFINCYINIVSNVWTKHWKLYVVIEAFLCFEACANVTIYSDNAWIALSSALLGLTFLISHRALQQYCHKSNQRRSYFSCFIEKIAFQGRCVYVFIHNWEQKQYL